MTAQEATATIRQTAALTPEETGALFGWGEDIFKAQGNTLVWGGGTQTHFILQIGGKPVCQLGALCHEVTVGDRRIWVAGFGGIVTRPEAQGRGYARRLMQHALKVCQRQWNIEAGMLFCLDHMMPFYRLAGWQQLEVPVIIEQPAGPVPAPGGVFVRPLNDRQWPGGTVFVNRLPW